jgi:DNA mismatch repair protein MutS
MSIAWAVVEYLVKRKNKKALTLFATHYHELTRLGNKYPEIKNYQVAVKREGDEIVFLHKVIEGSSWHSYGIEVAKLAGLPETVVKRSQYILRKTKDTQKGPTTRLSTEENKDQIELFDE